MLGIITNRQVVPDRYTIYEKDNNVEKIEFIVNEVNDNLNLTELYAFINLQYSDEKTNKILLSKTIEDEKVKLTLNIDNSVTCVQGLTLAQISFEKGDLSVVYSTAVFYIEVKNSIEGYENTQVTINSLNELQKKYIESLENSEKKIADILEKNKNKKLLILDEEYDGTKEVKIQPKTREITKFPYSFYSDYEGYTYDLKVRGMFKHEDPYSTGDGISNETIYGMGNVEIDRNDENYQKTKLIIYNLNGNFFEPTNEDVLTSGNLSVKTFMHDSTISINASKGTNATVKIPLNNKYFTYSDTYNLKVQYLSGSIISNFETVPLTIGLYNTNYSDGKIVKIENELTPNSMVNNNTGKGFSLDYGNLIIKVSVNLPDVDGYEIKDLVFKIVIEDEKFPVDDFPKSEVEKFELILNSPLYSVYSMDSDYNKTDEVYDELDLNTGKIIRRVKTAKVYYEDLVYYEDTEQIKWFGGKDSNGIDVSGLSQIGGKMLKRSSLRAISPTVGHDLGYADDNGESINMTNYLDPYDVSFIYFPCFMGYPLNTPYEEYVTKKPIRFRKGLNIFKLDCYLEPDFIKIKL